MLQYHGQIWDDVDSDDSAVTQIDHVTVTTPRRLLSVIWTTQSAPPKPRVAHAPKKAGVRRDDDFFHKRFGNESLVESF